MSAESLLSGGNKQFTKSRESLNPTADHKDEGRMFKSRSFHRPFMAKGAPLPSGTEKLQVSLLRDFPSFFKRLLPNCSLLLSHNAIMFLPFADPEAGCGRSLYRKEDQQYDSRQWHRERCLFEERRSVPARKAVLEETDRKA